MLKKLLVFLVLVCSSGFAFIFAQSNAILDELIAQKPVLLGQAAYLVLSAAGQIPDSATVDQATQMVHQKKWASPLLKASDPLPLDQLSYIIMSSLDIKGGLLYTIFPSPRYALRELTFLRVAAAPAWPDKLVAGDEAMRMLTKAMDIKEGK